MLTAVSKASLMPSLSKQKRANKLYRNVQLPKNWKKTPGKALMIYNGYGLVDSSEFGRHMDNMCRVATVNGVTVVHWTNMRTDEDHVNYNAVRYPTQPIILEVNFASTKNDLVDGEVYKAGAEAIKAFGLLVKPLLSLGFGLVAEFVIPAISFSWGDGCNPEERNFCLSLNFSNVVRPYIRMDATRHFDMPGEPFVTVRRLRPDEY